MSLHTESLFLFVTMWWRAFRERKKKDKELAYPVTLLGKTNPLSTIQGNNKRKGSSVAEYIPMCATKKNRKIMKLL